MAKKSDQNSTTALPNFFSVSRTIQYSDGVMTAVTDDGRHERIEVRELSVRGSKCSHGDAYELSKNDIKKVKSINTPNPQTVDGAFLPQDAKTLNLAFSMNVLPLSTDRQSCNNPAFTTKVNAFIAAFNQVKGAEEIAGLLAWRLATAAVLWRNSYGVEKTVTVTDSLNGSNWELDADAVDANSPEGFVAPDSLVSAIADALAGRTPVLMLRVNARVTIGYGQEVFPSQELEMKKGDGKSKVLYRVPFGNGMTAGMHPQKIGAALRAFDIWHPAYAKIGPLAVEPLGYSHKHQTSYRVPTDNSDLYNHLVEIEGITQSLTDSGEPSPKALFLAGCLMRGGVFSASAA